MMKYLFLGCLIIGFIACQNNNKQNQSNINDTLHLQKPDTLVYQIKKFSLKPDEFKNKPDSLTKAYVKAEYPVFESSEKELNNWISTKVVAAPLKDTSNITLEKAAENFIAEYHNFKKEFPEAAGGYEWEQTFEVNYQDSTLITFIHKNYGHTGGAHGMETTLYYNWDRDKKHLLKLDDILSSNYRMPLTAIAEQIFRKDEGLSPNESLDRFFFENQIFVLNDNFLITPEGLQFLYNPYEIKSYAEGITQLLIPYSKINDLIKMDGILSKYKNL